MDDVFEKESGSRQGHPCGFRATERCVQSWRKKEGSGDMEAERPCGLRWTLRHQGHVAIEVQGLRSTWS